MGLKWNELVVKSRFLSQSTGEELESFFDHVIVLLAAEETLDPKKWEQAMHWLKCMKGKLISYSWYRYENFHFNMIKMRYKAEKVAKDKEELYYSAILQIREIIKYLERIPDRDDADQAFSVVEKNLLIQEKISEQEREKKAREQEKEKGRPKMGAMLSMAKEQVQSSRRRISAPFYSTLSLLNRKQIIQDRLMEWKVELRNWYVEDGRIWDIIRLDKVYIEEYPDYDPIMDVEYRRYYVQEFMKWVEYLEGETNAQARKQYLSWMAEVMNVAAKVIEINLAGSSHQTFSQEFYFINPEKAVQLPTPGEIDAYLCVSEEIAEHLYDKDGDHLFKELIERLKKENLEQLIYDPLNLSNTNFIEYAEDGPYPPPFPEPYEEWCTRLELFLSHAPYFLSNEAPDEMVEFPKIEKLSEEKWTFLNIRYSLLKQEFKHAREALFEIKRRMEKDPNTINAFTSDQLKLIFVQTYGLFDKISIILNGYLGLKIHYNYLSFRNIWHHEGGSWGQGVRQELKSRLSKNPFFRSLYSLSRDLFCKERDWQQSLEAYHSDLPKLRNRIVHDYVHVILPNDPTIEMDGEIAEISLSDLYFKTESLLIKARDAILYLALFFHAE